MEPFKVFPQLVWEKMIENVEKPKDKLNLAQCHPQLEKLFENNIGEWMFASIAKYVFNYWAKKADDIQADEGFMSPQYIEVLDIFKDFLNCRLLSRNILKCTDAFTDKYYMKNRGERPSFFPFMMYATKNGLQKCLETCRASNKFPKSWNPMPLRHLTLCCNRGRTVEESFNMKDVKVFLQEVGFHLHSLCLGPVIQSRAQLAASPAIFCKIFNSLPNLLNFQLEARVTFELNEDPENRQAPVQILIPSKLPKLMHLTMSGHFDYLLLKGIDLSVYFSHLVHFNFCFSLWKDEYKKYAQFPELESIFFNYVPIPDAKESLFGLFHHMKTPKLKHIFLGLQDGAEFTTRKEYNWVVSFIQEMGMLALKQQFPVDYHCASYVSSVFRRAQNITDSIDFKVLREHFKN